jgi:hypothetical protein
MRMTRTERRLEPGRGLRIQLRRRSVVTVSAQDDSQVERGGEGERMVMAEDRPVRGESGLGAHLRLSSLAEDQQDIGQRRCWAVGRANLAAY